MILKIGDMWSCPQKPDYYLITTNSILNSKGHLVMGAGTALQAKKKYKGIDKVFGFYVKLHHFEGGVVGCVPNLYQGVGMFQTKYHYGNKSSLDLISISTNMLMEYIEKWAKNKIFYLPFPGINNGQLKEEEVLPIIKTLPDNVFIWKLR